MTGIFYFTFAVKDHSEWQGTDNTIITRATPSATKPEHKWMNEAGEVFKTRKAMKAAEAA